jgi:hypothetical protein
VPQNDRHRDHNPTVDNRPPRLRAHVPTTARRRPGCWCSRQVRGQRTQVPLHAAQTGRGVRSRRVAR